MPLDTGLLLLLDSRSPAGAHGHSGGMEPAIEAGMVLTVEDVADFCRGRLHTAGRVAAAVAAHACIGWQAQWTPTQWNELDQEVEARTASEAQRAASRNLGRGLVRLLRATRPHSDLRSPWTEIPGRVPHHPIALGAGCALLGAEPRSAARAAALGVCTMPASAAVRLLGLDPYATHSLLADLAEEISAVADDAAAQDILPATSAPAIDLLADVHITQEVRLFAS